jgi:D-galactarolactone isomerase
MDIWPNIPERMLWGSDWPHPSLPFDKKPDGAVLFDLLQQRAPNERDRNRILVDNPQTLYGFSKIWSAATSKPRIS